MQRLVEHSVRNNQVEVGIVMCEPGSPAKRYGGVHTGGEYTIYKTILASVHQPAGRRRSFLPTLLTRRPQSAAPAPAPAAVLPPGRRGRASWSSSPPRPCLRTGTDPVTAVCPEAVQPRPRQPKGVLKAPPRRLWPREHQACHRRLLLRRLHGDPAI